MGEIYLVYLWGQSELLLVAVIVLWLVNLPPCKVPPTMVNNPLIRPYLSGGVPYMGVGWLAIIVVGASGVTCMCFCCPKKKPSSCKLEKPFHTTDGVFLNIWWKLHPGGLTWNIIVEVWFTSFSKWLISRFHFNLPGCSSGWISWVFCFRKFLDPNEIAKFDFFFGSSSNETCHAGWSKINPQRFAKIGGQIPTTTRVSVFFVGLILFSTSPITKTWKKSVLLMDFFQPSLKKKRFEVETRLGKPVVESPEQCVPCLKGAPKKCRMNERSIFLQVL